MTKLRKLRVIITLTVTILIAGLLVWQHFNGGVPSHYFLQRADFPKMSNWWGLLLIPILSWILLGRVELRLIKLGNHSTRLNPVYKRVIALFATGFIWSMIIVVSFTKDYKAFLDLVPFIFLLLSFFIPIFYAEFILGFILGMTYTLGAILPTLFVLVFAGIGFLIYRFLRPLIFRFVQWLTKGKGKI